MRAYVVCTSNPLVQMGFEGVQRGSAPCRVIYS